jgi:hypothetical protein
MTSADAAPHEQVTTIFESDGNDADLRYLEGARAALTAVIAIIDAAASRTSRPDVRALARDALSVQTRRLAAVSSCLVVADRSGSPAPRAATTEVPAGLDGPRLEQVFVEVLTTHALASIVAASAEMVSGASHGARAIAEDATRAEYRQLAALDLVWPRGTTRAAQVTLS